MFTILNFDESPLCLSSKQFLPTDGHFTITAYHCKWYVFLVGEGGGGRGEGGREGEGREQHRH